MAELGGNIPILGQQQQKPRATSSMIVSLVRSLDENGTFEPESTFLNNGQVQAVAGRSNICSAEDLADMICDTLMPRLREIVKTEMKLAKLES